MHSIRNTPIQYGSIQLFLCIRYIRTNISENKAEKYSKYYKLKIIFSIRQPRLRWAYMKLRARVSKLVCLYSIITIMWYNIIIMMLKYTLGRLGFPLWRCVRRFLARPDRDGSRRFRRMTMTMTTPMRCSSSAWISAAKTSPLACNRSDRRR